MSAGTWRSGREVARALVVVLEEVGVDVELVEQHLGDGLVPALREPGAAVVAAAEVDRDREVVGTPADGGVDELGVGVRELVRVVATLDGALPHHRIAQVGEVRVVELDVPATGRVEGVDLGAVHRRQVGEEHLQVGVGVDVDPRPTAAEVHHRR